MKTFFSVLLVFVLGTYAASSAAKSAAPLLRVAIDNSVADQQTARSFEFETTLVNALRSAGLEHVDLTPLHSDFQRLKYTTELCAVVDANSTADDCAQFGNYAEAVIEVLENIRQAREADLIPGLRDEDLIVIMNADITYERRSVRVNLSYRVYLPGERRSAAEGVINENLEISARMTETSATDRVMDKAIRRAVASLSEKLT